MNNENNWGWEENRLGLLSLYLSEVATTEPERRVLVVSPNRKIASLVGIAMIRRALNDDALSR